MKPAESLEQTCVRKVLEETGLHVRVTKLVGIYTSGNVIIEYTDGSRAQPVAASFEAEVVGGELRLSDETTDFGYFPFDQLDGLDLMEHHLERIRDAIQNQEAAFLK